MMRKVGLLVLAVVFGWSSGVLASPIVFESTRDGNYEIYVMDGDGSNPRRLTYHSASDVGPSLSPDESQVAFYSDAGGNYQIYVMPSDGSTSGAATLVSSDTNLHRPSWSPDGDRLLFLAADGVNVMNADGSNRTLLASGSVDAPVFSFDGSRIAYAKHVGGNWDIWAMDADGSNQTQLTLGSAADQFPYFSPDGSQIAFTSAGDIWAMDADGTNPTRLTDDPAVDIYPTWSFDGSQILFNSERDGFRQIYSMNADGTNQINLSNTTTGEFAPRWSMGAVPEPSTALLLGIGLVGMAARRRVR